MATRLRSFSLKQIYNIAKSPNNIKSTLFQRNLLSSTKPSEPVVPSKYWKYSLIGGLGISLGLYTYFSPEKKNPGPISLTEKEDFTRNDNIVDIEPSREVLGPADIGLDLTLYQYQTCPFCCKVRAFLEFYGIPFQVIEVNPVMRQQLKFSTYKKVPILIAKEKESGKKHQLNDSTAIISILGTFLMDLDAGLKSVLKYYIPLAYTNDDGKKVEEIMNRYFLMFGDKPPKGRTDESVKKERKWRQWADQEFVHILSPNIYRTYDEALQAFNYFSEVGEWEKNFSTLERVMVIYVGAIAMYFVGKRLKKRHALKEDERQSLYEACRVWTKEIGTKQKYMGGDLPNLADLAVYGLLSSIEGCLAFKDLLKNTNIGPWYYNVKEAVANHHGYKYIQ